MSDLEEPGRQLGIESSERRQLSEWRDGGKAEHSVLRRRTRMQPGALTRAGHYGRLFAKFCMTVAVDINGAFQFRLHDWLPFKLFQHIIAQGQSQTALVLRYTCIHKHNENHTRAYIELTTAMHPKPRPKANITVITVAATLRPWPKGPFQSDGDWRATSVAGTTIPEALQAVTYAKSEGRQDMVH